MTEYLMIAAVMAVQADKRAPFLVQLTGTSPEGSSQRAGFEVPAALFEDNAVEITPGTGQALKAVAATALLGAMHGLPLPGLPQDAANDEESAAERGEFNDAMITAVARIAFNVVREWKKYEGLLHHPPFDEASELQQNMARTRVRNIAQNVRYPLDIANKANVFEDQMYRIVCAAVLAD